jgi:hypothetical protein
LLPEDQEKLPRYVRSLYFSLATVALITVLADCGGGGGGGSSVIPTDGGQGANLVTTLSTGSANPYSSDTGQIVSLTSSGFTMQDANGTVTVDTSASKHFHGPNAAAGEYAMAIGTVSGSTIEALAVGTATSPFGTVTVSGPVVGVMADGFEIQGGSGIGYINVFILSTTTVQGSTTIHGGEKVAVTGIGSLSTQIAASTVTVVTSSPSPTPAASAAPSASPSSAPPSSASPSPTPISTIAPTTGPIIVVPSGVSTWAGPFVGFFKGGFEIHAANGYTNILTNSNTVINGTLQKGAYVQATGTGTPYTGVSGIYVAAYETQPVTVTVAGTVSQSTNYGFSLASGSSTKVPIVLNSKTLVAGGVLAVGASVQVTGVGSAANSVTAAQIVVSEPTPDPTPTPGPISQTHVLTVDYLGAPNGSTAVSWAAAAPYLSWAEAAPSNSAAIHAAGIRTELYVDPNRAMTNSPMYSADETEFAHDCSGRRITTTLYNQTLYVMDATSSSLQNHFQQYTSSVPGTFDAVFEDDAGPLTDFTESKFSGTPCNYTDASWLSGGEALNASSALPVIFNGLSANGDQPISPSIAFLSGSNTIGGAMEGCYTSPTVVKATGSTPGSWWADVENTEIQVAAQNKIFECYAKGAGPSASYTDARLYVYASFLLTYNPGASALWETFSTPTGFDVNPESGLVALDPKVPEPSSVSALQQPGGAFGREYGECYLRGKFVGPCAAVVNPDPGTSPVFPFPQYRHTLVLSGSGVLDGGALATNGPPPPEYLTGGQAEIVFP